LRQKFVKESRVEVEMVAERDARAEPNRYVALLYNHDDS
jgi:hypothetical protein